jgi:hypothetical protein
MASQPPPAPITVTALGDDLVREIFLRLPALPSLVRAAFACRAFRRAVRSSPAFRRRFRELHAPPLLALFLEPNMEVIPAFPSLWRRSDPDLLAADFFRTSCSGHGPGSGWEIDTSLPKIQGYFDLRNVSTKLEANYNPLSQALKFYPDGTQQFEFHTLTCEDDPRPSRVLCVRHNHLWTRATVAVFSSRTMKWQIFPETNTLLHEKPRTMIGTVLAELIYWTHWSEDCILVLDTAAFQFSLIDLPMTFVGGCIPLKLGKTKDGKLCIVEIKENTLVAWFRTADSDGIDEMWMMYKMFPLCPIVKEVTKCSIEEDGDVMLQVVAVIDGIVYLSNFYRKDTKPCELLLSLRLETAEMNKLFEGGYRYHDDAHPYTMAWPPSLVQNKVSPCLYVKFSSTVLSVDCMQLSYLRVLDY